MKLSLRGGPAITLANRACVFAAQPAAGGANIGVIANKDAKRDGRGKPSPIFTFPRPGKWFVAVTGQPKNCVTFKAFTVRWAELILTSP